MEFREGSRFWEVIIYHIGGFNTRAAREKAGCARIAHATVLLVLNFNPYVFFSSRVFLITN